MIGGREKEGRIGKRQGKGELVGEEETLQGFLGWERKIGRRKGKEKKFLGSWASAPDKSTLFSKRKDTDNV
ncbi:MAG: hypothetical protein EKK63_02395 [Acinetobacter sp.]|uniref:hypothetical protein n=1 Tax=Acinetobacter sp. TaxID=472 RepID=UPI000F9139ED|nr:hypothetical protein [Acinetobacter sp.]RUP42167.1 MAG: hypothetical protein EKK63_02395 [Acinetobacter sp.]